MRETYVHRNGKLVSKHEVPAIHSRVSGVISDTIAPTWHPASGAVYDSKKRFRDETRARGCVEVGNDRQSDGRRPFHGNARADVARAVQMVRSGYRPTVQREGDF